MARLFLFGASGHAKVVIDAIEHIGQHRIAGLFDDAPERRGAALLGYTVLGGREELLARRNMADGAIVSIGANDVRTRVAAWLVERGIALVSVVHPGTHIAREVMIGAGSVVMAGCVINSGAQVGCNVIINTSATVDHDCLIGDGAHIAPGCRLCGGVSVGSGALVGVGTSVIPGIRIGAGAVIGAGSTVLHDVPDGAHVAGSPCRPISA
mgnify:CR=1 FL=1